MKYWKFITSIIFLPIILLLGYSLALISTIAFFIIEFKWEFNETRESLNLPALSEVWFDFIDFLKDFKNDRY